MLRSRRSLIVERRTHFLLISDHRACIHPIHSMRGDPSCPVTDVYRFSSTFSRAPPLHPHSKELLVLLTRHYRITSRADPNVVMPSKRDWLTSGNYQSFHSWMEIPLRDTLKFTLRKALGNHTCDPGGAVVMTKRHPQLTLH
jgi:hypothetical protein